MTEQKRVYKKSTLTTGVIPKSIKSKASMYIDNDAFYQALVDRKAEVEAAKAAGLESPQLSNFIGDCFIKIAKNLSKKYQFSGYSWRDEMVSDAIVHCVRYVDSFNVEKTNNPFSYFTQAVYYQFLARIEQEKEESYVKYHATLTSAAYGEACNNPDDDSYEIDMGDLDIAYMNTFVSEFERKQAEKKAGVPKKKSKKPSLFDDGVEETV